MRTRDRRTAGGTIVDADTDHELKVDENAFVAPVAADSFADPAVSASEADSYGIGLNWYLNENVKWLLDYEHTTFEGGAAAGADRRDEDAYQLRLAVGF
jgi:phosphate-selective porin OprO/OprP